MATISQNDSAPSEAVHYNLAGYEFDLGGRKKSIDTADQDVIDNAARHPWLMVSYPEVDVVSGAYIEQISPVDDPLSRENDKANDPKAAQAAEDAKMSVDDNLVGIEAGLDQTVSHSDGPIAKTVAATDSDKVKD